MADPNLQYLTADAWVESPHRAFGLMRSPPFTIHDDFFEAIGRADAIESGAFIDPNSHVLIARPTPLPDDTTFGAGYLGWTVDSSGGATTHWHDDTISPDTGKRCLLMDDANVDVIGKAFSSWTPDIATPHFIKIVKGPAAQDATHDRDHIYFVLNFGFDDGMAVAYQIGAPYGEPFTLEEYTSADGWHRIRTSDGIADSYQYMRDNADTVFITWLPIRSKNTISVYLGNGDADLSFTPKAFPHDVIRFEGKNGKTRLEYFPVGYPTVWSFKSGPKETGFQPLTDPQGKIWPDGTHHPATPSTPDIPAYPSPAEGTCTATITVLPPDIPTQYRYRIDGTNPQYGPFPTGYARVTPILEYAEIYFPPLTYNDTFSVPIPLNMVHVTERHQVDWNNLNFFRQATIVCDNFHGQWSFSSGMRAILLERGWNGFNTPGLIGWVGETTSFMRRDPIRQVTFTAFDKSFPLRRRKCGILPFLDGWCIYAAIRFLAGIGGITSDWLAMIPDCPTGPAPMNCNHPWLPVGTGTRPRWRCSEKAPLWSEMNRIRALYRHVLGFDQYGFLRFEPFDVTTLPYYGIYSTTPQFDPITGEPFFNEITTSVEVVASVADVRSEITLIGINPSDSWSPIVSHAQNDSIVFDPTDPAFLGFPDPWVEIDPIFTNLDFMNTFLALMEQQAALPAVNPSFGAHLQPNLHILDRFTLVEPLTWGADDLYCTGLTHEYARNEDNTYSGTTAIMGKAVANLFG